MVQHHSRAGESHDSANLFFHIGTVAVGGAGGAKVLCVAVGTVSQPFCHIFFERKALGVICPLMIFLAVEVYHQKTDLLFLIYPHDFLCSPMGIESEATAKSLLFAGEWWCWLHWEDAPVLNPLGYRHS